MTREKLEQGAKLEKAIIKTERSREFVEKGELEDLLEGLMQFQPSSSCIEDIEKILLKEINGEIQRLEKEMEEL